MVCADGLSRYLLNKIGITVDVYFTHAQLTITTRVDIKLRTLVMPAIFKRLMIESKINNYLWDNLSLDIIADVIELGGIQSLNGHFCSVQISKICTELMVKIDRILSEETIRKEIGLILHTLDNLPGTLHNCLVALTPYSSARVRRIETFTGIYLFSRFTNILVFAPPLTRRFANRIIENSRQIPVIN